MNVSWDGARLFPRKLRQETGTDKYVFPAEAKGEYSAKAGTTTAYFSGDAEKSLGDYAWRGRRAETKRVWVKGNAIIHEGYTRAVKGVVFPVVA
jgi:formylglycine-generating enzyme required for sulfatase activity